VHRQRTEPMIGQRDSEHCEGDIPRKNDGDKPPGDDIPPRETDQRRENIQPISRRIEQLAEARDLVEPPREKAIQKIGDTRDDENEEGEGVPLGNNEVQKDWNKRKSEETQ
jgi:hypothetical protein